MDRGTWQATVHRVTKSHRRLTEQLSTRVCAYTHTHKNKETTVDMALKDGPVQ